MQSCPESRDCLACQISPNCWEGFKVGGGDLALRPDFRGSAEIDPSKQTLPGTDSGRTLCGPNLAFGRVVKQA